MAEQRQQKKKANNHRSAKNKKTKSPQKKAPAKSKSSPAKPTKSALDRSELEQDRETDGLAEVFKCLNQQLLEDAADIAKRVTNQIERRFTIKQVMDGMKKYKGKPTMVNSFEKLLSDLEQEARRDSSN